ERERKVFAGASGGEQTRGTMLEHPPNVVAICLLGELAAVIEVRDWKGKQSFANTPGQFGWSHGAHGATSESAGKGVRAARELYTYSERRHRRAHFRDR